jgi:uncharacterized protein
VKISTYCIPLKLNEDEYLLINSRTGAVDLVDREVLDCMYALSGDSSILAFLQEGGHLTDLTPEQELNQMEEFCKLLYAQFSRVKTHVIIPTYNCNLRCPYCWERFLHSKGKTWLEKTLSFAEVDLFFEALKKLDKGVSEKKPLIYFGGEPLLESNRELIEYIVNQGTKRGYPHYFVTNGTTIPYYLSLFKKHPVHGVQVTLDGTQNIHDSRRRGPKKEGSFQRIIEGIELLREQKIKTHIRVNVDQSNVGSLKELAALFKSMKWHTDQVIVPYLAPVFAHQCGGYSSAYAKEDFIPLLLTLWEQDFLWEVFKRGVIDFNPLETVLKGGTWSPKFYACRAHSNQLLFDPHGRIYTCWEAVGEAAHCVGHFIPRLKFNKTYTEWTRRTVFTIEECRSCSYAFLCGGGCAYEAYKTKGTLSAPFCGYTEKVLKEYIPFFYCKLFEKYKTSQ